MSRQFIFRKSKNYVEVFWADEKGQTPLSTFVCMEFAINGVMNFVTNLGWTEFSVKIEIV